MLIAPYALCILYILFIKKNAKYTWAVAASAIAFLSISSTTYADLSNYVPLFEYINRIDLVIAAQTTGIGWACLNKLFFMLGLNYRGMVVGMLYVNYYLMHIAVRRLKANENLFFGLFLIFPAVIQLVQFKFFTAFCIVFVGYSLLVTSDRFPRIKYIILVVLAALVHVSNVMFLLLLLVRIKRYDRKLFALITAELTLFMILFLNPIVNLISRYLNPKLTARYLTNSITPSSLTWIILIFCVWLMSFIISTYLLSNRAFTCMIEDATVRVKDYCGMAIEILLLTLPFLLLDRNYHRFMEMGYSILFVITGMYISPPRYSRNRIVFIFLFIALLMVVSYIYCPYETVLRPLFSFEGFVNLRW